MNLACLCLARALLMSTLRQNYPAQESRGPRERLPGPTILSELGGRLLDDKSRTFASLLRSRLESLFATHPPPCFVLRSIRFGLSHPRFPLVSLARSAGGSHSVTLVRYICVQRVDASIKAMEITICGDLSSNKGR